MHPSFEACVIVIFHICCYLLIYCWFCLEFFTSACLGFISCSSFFIFWIFIKLKSHLFKFIFFWFNLIMNHLHSNQCPSSLFHIFRFPLFKGLWLLLLTPCLVPNSLISWFVWDIDLNFILLVFIWVLFWGVFLFYRVWLFWEFPSAMLCGWLGIILILMFFGVILCIGFLNRSSPCCCIWFSINLDFVGFLYLVALWIG